MSTPVKGINPLMNYVSTKQTGSTSGNLAGSFSDTFSKASGQTDIQDTSLSNDNAVKSSQIKVSRTDKRGLDTKDSSAETKVDNVQSSGVNKATEDAVHKAGEELVNEVSQELGIPVEEVEAAMETLGLTLADLLNPDNMTQLVLTLKGADMLTVMTDEGLYNSLKNLLGKINETVNVLQEQTGLTQEEIAAILEQAAPKEEQAQANNYVKAVSAQDTEAVPEEQKNYTVTVERDGEVVEINVKADGSDKEESPELISKKVEAPEEETSDSPKDGSSPRDSSSHGSNIYNNVLLENLLNRSNTTAAADAVFESTMTGQTANTQDIMNQIMDYMKVQIKADMTQMEIQLHPASLGTVNINITSKDGVITAQFLTQNEAVKAAIESQIVQLRNNFEEQGLKVESVEVTVESHQFERNLNGDGSGQEQAQQGKKKSIRKINLNELNPESEAELNEEEQIAVAMMTADGSTVDLTA